MAGDGRALVGVALVGTGLAGRMHANGLRLLGGEARLLGAAGTSAEKSAAFAAEFGLPRAYRDLDELLADGEVTAVHICTPPHTHVDLAEKLAAAGKHMLIDKPIARNVAEADAIIAACDRAGVILAGLFQERWGEDALAVKSAIQDGRLGDLHLADCYVKWWRDDAYFTGSKWRARQATEGGGALINQAIHSIDLLQWLAGPALEVAGRIETAAHRIETEDVGVAVVRLEGGRGGGRKPALGVIEGSTAAYPGFPSRLELHGSRGSVTIGQDGAAWYLQGEAPRPPAPRRVAGSSSDPAAVLPEGHAAGFRDFLAAVRTGRPPQLDGREARRAVEIVEAIYRSSAAGGAPVKLPLT